MTKPKQAYGSSMPLNFKCVLGPIHLSFSLVQTFQMLKKKKKFVSFNNNKKNFFKLQKKLLTIV